MNARSPHASLAMLVAASLALLAAGCDGGSADPDSSATPLGADADAGPSLTGDAAESPELGADAATDASTGGSRDAGADEGGRRARADAVGGEDVAPETGTVATICPGNACGEGCDPCGPWKLCIDGTCVPIDCECVSSAWPDGCAGMCSGPPCGSLPTDDCDGDGDPEATDCAPDDPAIFTGAVELCNEVDDDCDGEIDEDFHVDAGDPAIADADGDGVPDELDCAPDEALANQCLGEICDGVDNDCDGVIDEGFGDNDGDGWGDCVDTDDDDDGDPDETDCAPLNPQRHHGKAEQCNGVDDDCDGETDEDFFGTGGEPDSDGDGVIDAADCAPDDPLTSPCRSELCDGLDNDCDGEVDEHFRDSDDDGVAYCMDDDDDGDGIGEAMDNCPTVPNPDQQDTDGDGIGDACSYDLDEDGDGMWNAGSAGCASDADCPGGGVCDPVYGTCTWSCTPDCAGRQCGADGCGGSCGSCAAGESCTGSGSCASACVPDCTGKAGADPDGCGGQCSGSGTGGPVEPPDCLPECVGRDAGEPDGCGGLCDGGGTSIGLVPGGAQDAGYFKLLVSQGKVPTPELLPIEGLLNEHGTPLPAPDPAITLSLHGFVGLHYDPVESEQLIAMQLGMNSGLSPEKIAAGRFNLSVVVDKSGSMAGTSIEAVRDGLTLMVDSLDANDILSIIVYDRTAKVLLPATPVEDKESIKALIASIRAGGSTNLYEGMVLGYGEVIAHIDPTRINRIMLLSDGQTNTGLTDLAQILQKSSEYNEAGIGITTIGVGTGFNFELMHLLATQGSGNFYFIDTAAKLQEVFKEDVEYLLTPVAHGLHVSFTLTEGFSVADIYGFDYKQVGGEVILLAPKPEYPVGGAEPPDDPGDPGDPGDPSAGGPDLAVPSVFAAKKNGLLMMRIEGPGPQALLDLPELDFAEIHYDYTLADTGEVESGVRHVALGEAERSEDGDVSFYSGDIMRRNFCLLRLGLAMKEACRLVHEEESVDLATLRLDRADLFCSAVFEDVPDMAIAQELAVLDALRENIEDGELWAGAGAAE